MYAWAPNSSFDQSTCVYLQLQKNTNIYILWEIATSGSIIMLMHWSSLCSSAPAYMLHHIIVCVSLNYKNV